MRAAGIDGCKGGWIGVTRAGSEPVEAYCATTISTLISMTREPDVIAIDIPIGLMECGARLCDQEARRLLGRRACTVFTAPLRSVLEENSWAGACETRFRIDGKRMSQQAWAITPKVKEVDSLVRMDPALRGRLRETHPELCFLAWTGSPMMHGKKKPAGRSARRTVVDRHFGTRTVADVLDRFPRSVVGYDDILDAFAALWTAERVLRGDARVIPANPPADTRGVTMEIVF